MITQAIPSISWPDRNSNTESTCHPFLSFPLLFEEGWTRPQQNIAKPPLWSGRVVSKFQQNLMVFSHHPVCASKVASRLLYRAAPPPRRGGETSPPIYVTSFEGPAKLRESSELSWTAQPRR